ncbi:MAG: hypothetical protein IJT89_12550 [Bacteroidaceae bacterium]|nr:hypothetical protein [Bacteroidaceae bacterium]
MMKKIIFFALLAISATMAMAQVNPKSGIIITNSGDTIKGNIDFRSNEALAKECRFWADGESNGKTYKPGDIEGFRFDDNGKYFVTRKLEVYGKPQLFFAEFMVKGKMNLYCVADDSEEHFFFEREDGEMVKFTNNSLAYLSSVQEGENIMQKRKEQYGKVKYLLKDSKTAIEDMNKKGMSKKILSRKGLVNVVRNYHNDVCTDGSTCMVYEYDEKSDKSKFRFKAFTSFAYYSKEAPELLDWTIERNNQGMPSVTYSSSSFEIGVGTEMGIERIIKDGSLELGLAYSPKNRTECNIEFFGGQRQYRMEYEYKGRFIFSLGLVKPFGKGKIVPFVRGGGICVVDMGERETAYTGSQVYETAYLGTTSYSGGYLGAGVQMAVGKHVVKLHADLYADLHSMTKWGITAEFVL